MDIQTIERMRHIWKDARGKYASFFACLEEVRQEVGNEALSDWCIDNLRVSLDNIVKFKIFLRDDDAARVKRELAEAIKASKEQKRRNKEEKTCRRKITDSEHKAHTIAKDIQKGSSEFVLMTIYPLGPKEKQHKCLCPKCGYNMRITGVWVKKVHQFVRPACGTRKRISL